MRPQIGDYDPYYKDYIDFVIGDDIIHILNEQSQETHQLLDCFSVKKGNYAYAEGKWTVKEVIGHLIDTERIFAYRALAIARGEKKSLSGFDQDEYNKSGYFNSRDLFDLTYEFRLMRESNILFFRGLDKSVLQNRGIVNGNEITVLAIMFIIAGHQKHHCKILKEKYL
jgi:uncharacterized damage-inducible protein DinB